MDAQAPVESNSVSPAILKLLPKLTSVMKSVVTVMILVNMLATMEILMLTTVVHPHAQSTKAGIVTEVLQLVQILVTKLVEMEETITLSV